MFEGGHHTQRRSQNTESPSRKSTPDFRAAKRMQQKEVEESPMAPAARALQNGVDLPDDFDMPDNRFNHLLFTSAGQQDKNVRSSSSMDVDVPVDRSQSKASALTVDFV